MKTEEFIIIPVKETNGVKLVYPMKDNEYLNYLAEREGIIYRLEDMLLAMNRIQCDVKREYGYKKWACFNFIETYQE